MDDYYEEYLERRYVVLLLDSEEEYQDLISALSEQLLINDTDAIAYHNRGLAYLELGDERGLNDIETSISINSAAKEPYKVLGQFWERNSDLVTALEYFSKAINADNNDATNYRCRASVYESLGKINHAIEDLNSAIEIEPSFEYSKTHRDKLIGKSAS